MRYFTNNPLERLMMQKPKAAREDSPPAAAKEHFCYGCKRFGQSCVRPSRHVSMLEALRVQLAAVGVDPARICDAGICTQCNPQQYFSYRASGGTCGRHGAIAFRKEA